jgi:hypothetical protein
MAIQLQASGETIYGISPFSITSNGAQSLAGWINASGAWFGLSSARSMIGMYSSSNVSGGAGAAIQIGTRGTAASPGQVDIWEWGGTVMVSSTGFTPPVGSWFHVAATYDGTNCRIYINGVLNNTGAFTKTAGYNYNMVFLDGYIYGVTAESSVFAIDDVAAYSRVLSANEILTLYNSRGMRDGMMYGCVARFTFDEQPVGFNVDYVQDESQYVANILPQSNGAFTNPGGTGWTTGAGFTITTNAAVAPDSSTTASRIVYTTTTAATTYTTSITTTASTTYHADLLIKNNGGTGSINITMGNIAGTIQAYMTISLATMTVTANGGTAGVTSPTYYYTPLYNGWYTLTVIGTFTAAGTAIVLGIAGISGTGNFYAWGPDLYTAGADGSYIANSAAPNDIRMVQI